MAEATGGDPSGEQEPDPIPPSQLSVPVVGIGASAGGLDAFRKFFPQVPMDGGMAYVVIMHLNPEHESRLAELIGQMTRLPVTQASQGTKLEPNHVYVAPPGTDLTVAGGRLQASHPKDIHGRRNPIDVFLESLAAVGGEYVGCVILSGTGSDGTIGLRAVKAHGGLTMAQAGASAQYDGMMNSALATGLVDFVLPPEEMPAKLAGYFSHLKSLRAKKGRGSYETKAAEHLGKICALLRAGTGHDFSNYKDKTILRRVQRRMQVLQIEDVPEFLDTLRKDPHQVELLFQDLLIGVTHFFRDRSAFEALEREVMPKLFEGKGADDSVRVWVPGCSTGEEAYSIAMLLREQLAKASGAPKIQIFATDIDERALEIARVARYPAALTQNISPARLQRFFLREDGTYRIVSDLREICLFSAHNLLRDPPFSKIDLISCRNLLIYFSADLQDRVIPLFHYALRENGYLFLGSSENVTRHSRLFGAVDKSHRIFKRRTQLGHILPQFPLAPPDAGHRTRAQGRFSPAGEPSVLQRAERTVLERYSPPFVVINRDGDIIHFSGQTGNYLEPAPGAPDNNIFRMARPGLRPMLRVAVDRCVSTGHTTVQKNLSVSINGGHQAIDLIVQPVREDGPADEPYVVVFQNVGGFELAAEDGAETAPDAESVALRQLEGELQSTRERLQIMTEELEASNEELKSSNEELSSMNEELQSANEELETSKEELQSINEELHTVNAELNARVEEISRANSDIINLLENTQIATVFLDRDFNIKSFTPAAKDLFHLIESDPGRPISHVRSRFAPDTIEEDAEKVLRSLSTIERKVASTDQDARYVMRILPYRTVGNVIGGVVVTFVDITSIAAAEAKIRQLNLELRNRLEEMETLLDFVPAGILLVDESHGGKVRVNSYGARLAAQERDGNGLVTLYEPLRLESNGEAIPQADQPLQRAARTGQPVPTLEAQLVRADGSTVCVLISAMPLSDERGKTRGAIGAMVDINDRKKSEARQQVLLHELQHRVKNILATVVALATRMRRSSETAEGFSAALIDRLRAMAQTQELLSRRGEHSVQLRELIGIAAAPHEETGRDNFRLSGPDVKIPAENATTLGMVLYELATNAVKYGALSAPGGVVDLSWQAGTGDGAAALTMTWEERGGPKIAEPPDAGFGTTFVKRSIEYELGGTAKLDFGPEGFRCVMSLPLETEV